MLQEEGRNNDLGRGGQHGCDRGLGEGMEEIENGAGFSGMKITRRHSCHRITVWWLRFFFSSYYLFKFLIHNYFILIYMHYKIGDVGCVPHHQTNRLFYER